MRNAARAGLRILNVMLGTYHADGHELTDAEVIETYRGMAEVGAQVGVTVSFELVTKSPANAERTLRKTTIQSTVTTIAGASPLGAIRM